MAFPLPLKPHWLVVDYNFIVQPNFIQSHQMTFIITLNYSEDPKVSKKSKHVRMDK